MEVMYNFLSKYDKEKLMEFIYNLRKWWFLDYNDSPFFLNYMPIRSGHIKFYRGSFYFLFLCSLQVRREFLLKWFQVSYSSNRSSHSLSLCGWCFSGVYWLFVLYYFVRVNSTYKKFASHHFLFKRIVTWK